MSVCLQRCQIREEEDRNYGDGGDEAKLGMMMMTIRVMLVLMVMVIVINVNKRSLRNFSYLKSLH